MPFGTNNYTADDFKSILKADFYSVSDKNALINHILIDSRKLINPAQTIFFALKTESNDGHKYLAELYNKGVVNFVVSSDKELNFLKGKANVFFVDDTLKALQKLGAAHRAHFKMPVTAITGSNGKTIVKEWLFQLMSPDKKIVRSPKSYNSQIGVPLSVWQINSSDELALFEAGISKPDEMEALRNILEPEVGIFTNIGHAHDENFISMAQKIGEKLKLFTKVDTLIYCADYSDIQEKIIKSELQKNINFFTWSRKKGSTLYIKNITKAEKCTFIEGVYNKQSLKIDIPFTDNASVENAVHCWCFMLYMGYPNDTIAPRMSRLAPVAMRLEIKEGVNGSTIINDAYNSDINSLAIALDLLKQQQQHKIKTLILSDILQSGKPEAELYEEVAALVEEKKIDKLIGVGKSISRQSHLFKDNATFFYTTHDFIKGFSFSELQKEAILLKGAREFEFEKIVAFLQQKTHKTTLEINLNAIRHNLNFFKSKLAPHVKVMAMVKAFSYGTGSYEIANVLQYNRVDYLGVAFSDEGKALRKAGIALPIMVMSPDETGFDDMIKYNLEPEIYSFRILELFLEALQRNESDKSYTVHIKLDTGMHRLGFVNEEVEKLGETLKTLQSKIRVGSVFTHLAASDMPEEDAFTHKQLQFYVAMCDKLKAFVKTPFMKHVVNSAGILRFPEYHFDMVRLGIGLYGIAFSPEHQKHLENVSTMRTSVSQIKKIPAKETVGYNRSGYAHKEMQLATVPVGYADGLSRTLGNGVGTMKINGQPASIFGNVCMDMCMLDISRFDVLEGQEVIVFDDAASIKKLAKDMNTIPYEVLTSFSRRVKRVYFHE